MRIPKPAIVDWIFRTLQSCISLCEFVMLGLPLLDKEYILALENQAARLVWLTNELRHRTRLSPITVARTEYQMRMDCELLDDEELPYAVVLAPPSDTDMERFTHGET